jgi:hypothetical protein
MKTPAETSARAPGAPFRLLVVAAEEIAGSEIADAVAQRVRGDGSEVRLIAPAVDQSPLEHAMGDVDEATEQARDRATRSAAALGAAGLEVAAEVGDPDLRLAIQDALQDFAADEIVIVAHREGGSYLERQGIEEAERDFKPPITELYVEAAGAGPRVAEVERKPAGQPIADPEEAESRSRNLPPFSTRDLLGIVVAIVGTIMLVILAATGNDNLNSSGGFGTDDGGFTQQSARILIAGAFGLINLAHVVGLVLFQSGPYRGWARDLFAKLSLFGTPVAIVACLILL